jgi:hypothetical protein
MLYQHGKSPIRNSIPTGLLTNGCSDKLKLLPYSNLSKFRGFFFKELSQNVNLRQEIKTRIRRESCKGSYKDIFWGKQNLKRTFCMKRNMGW